MSWAGLAVDGMGWDWGRMGETLRLLVADPGAVAAEVLSEKEKCRSERGGRKGLATVVCRVEKRKSMLHR